jgi:hypothetical protein
MWIVFAGPAAIPPQQAIAAKSVWLIVRRILQTLLYFEVSFLGMVG